MRAHSRIQSPFLARIRQQRGPRVIVYILATFALLLYITYSRQRLFERGRTLTPLYLARSYQDFFCDEVHPLPANPDFISTTVKMPPNAVVPYVKMYLFGGRDIVSSSIANSGSWESDDSDKLLRIMQLPSTTSQPLFVDIGSNVGWYTVFIAAHGYPVVAFDAMRANGHLLRSTLCENPALMDRVTFINKGLSEDSQECVVFSDDQNMGDGHIGCADPVTQEKPKIPENYSIRNRLQLVRLDEFVAQDIRLLKIDVEGFEKHVMDGAARLFERHTVSYVMSEFSVGFIKGKGSDPWAYIDMFIQWGYDISTTDFEGPYAATEGNIDRKELAKAGFLNLYMKKVRKGHRYRQS